MEKLGILVLGQTPRPDIKALFAAYLPGTELIVQGALDGLATEAIDDLARRKGDYPLLVILADGTTREISMSLPGAPSQCRRPRPSGQRRFRGHLVLRG